MRFWMKRWIVELKQKEKKTRSQNINTSQCYLNEQRARSVANEVKTRTANWPLANVSVNRKFWIYICSTPAHTHTLHHFHVFTFIFFLSPIIYLKEEQKTVPSIFFHEFWLCNRFFCFWIFKKAMNKKKTESKPIINSCSTNARSKAKRVNAELLIAVTSWMNTHIIIIVGSTAIALRGFHERNYELRLLYMCITFRLILPLYEFIWMPCAHHKCFELLRWLKVNTHICCTFCHRQYKNWWNSENQKKNNNIERSSRYESIETTILPAARSHRKNYTLRDEFWIFC